MTTAKASQLVVSLLVIENQFLSTFSSDHPCTGLHPPVIDTSDVSHSLLPSLMSPLVLLLLAFLEFFTLQPPSISPSLELNNVLWANLKVESSLAPPLGADLPSHRLSGAPAVAKQAAVFPSLEGSAVITDQCQQEPA